MGFTPGTDDVRGRPALRVDQSGRRNRCRVPRLTVHRPGAAIADEPAHLLISKEYTAVEMMQPDFNQSDFRDAREGRLFFTSEQTGAVRQTARMLVTP